MNSSQLNLVSLKIFIEVHFFIPQSRIKNNEYKEIFATNYTNDLYKKYMQL